MSPELLSGPSRVWVVCVGNVTKGSFLVLYTGDQGVGVQLGLE